MSALSTRPPDNRRNDDSRDYWRQTPPWYVMLASGMLIVILVAVLLLLVRDEGDDIQTVAPALPTTVSSSIADSTTAPGSTDTTAASSTSVASTTSVSSSSTLSTTATTATTVSSTVPSSTASTSVSTTIDPQQYRSAVWPPVDSATRYREPVPAAIGFADEFLGFEDPVAGPFQQGDSRSGEVAIRPTADGPVTTVLVRQLGPDNTWWVLGSASENITIDEPDALDEIGEPLLVTGSALAFEGVVEVRLYGDDLATPLVSGVVVGGGTSKEPFEGRFDWTNPGAEAGTLVLMTTSMDDGQTWEASVVRVLFPDS